MPNHYPKRLSGQRIGRFSAIVVLVAIVAPALALDLTVTDPQGNPVSGYRWMAEEDTTNVSVPGALVANSISLDIHNSYAPVMAKGEAASSNATINLPSTKRYIVSVLPYAGYSNGGGIAAVGQTSMTVVVNPFPIPTAQISVFVFADQNPINNVADEHEQGIGDATIVISDNVGQVMMDAFGNPLGTMYQMNPDGTFVMDGGAPVVDMMGTGIITTLTQEDFDAGNNPYKLKVGEALIKFISPGKYGIVVNPPAFDDLGQPMEWVQTATIEGTPTIDAWVKENEPRIFVEGFGTGFNHAFFGFVKTSPTSDSNFKGQAFGVTPWNQQAPAGTGTIQGRLRLNHFSRPPITQGFFPGDIIGEGWIGLNDPLARPGAQLEQGGPLQFAGLYVAPCNPDGTFTIANVPAGTYQLVTWDKPLDNLFGFHSVTVGAGEHVNLGDVLEYRWFGTLEGSVFYDADQDGFRDPDEKGIINQNLNIRFRDGTIYQSTVTDPMGEYAFEEVFPFFKWLVVEVDFARFKDTGMTTVVDGGGEVLPDNGWDMPSRDKLNPLAHPEINPNTGNNLSRTQVSTSPGEVLLQAMHLFLNQTNIIDWGKIAYGMGETGGISGIVYYATTRAENDPRYAVGDPWEPGIPRVQVALYMDTNCDGVIDDLDGDGLPTRADVDNYPFDDPSLPVWDFFPGPEDQDWNGNFTFDPGDAIQIVTSDCWDDNKPTGSIQPPMEVHGQPVTPGFDSYGTWNQVRPGVFDGGYAIGSYFPGGMASGSDEVDGLPRGVYIVEAATPYGYTLVKEEDKNVDFGDSYIPSPLMIPPPVVGELREVQQYLSFQTDEAGVPLPGIDPADLIEAPFAFVTTNQMRPTPDRKQVRVSDGKNAAADFFFFTQVPKAGRGVGFANNDLAAEFNVLSPNFGEKTAPAWIPIALRDWTGKEFSRVYTDEFGGYNFLVPSTYTVNIPMPSGVSPHMVTLVLNDPIMPDGTIDPFYNPVYSITPWTFQYFPGTTSYLDTPLVPLAAFAAAEVKLDTEPADLTPVILSLDGPEPGIGPVLCSSFPNGRVITLRSKGITTIVNPAYSPYVPGSQFRITRNYGFGNTQGQVLLNGTPLSNTNILSWTDAEIRARVPQSAVTSRVTVTRGDNSATTELGVTLHVVNCASTTIRYVPAGYASIQEAIDASNPGDLILVAPGVYNENIVMNKPVRLQGSGAGGTTIFGYPNPLDKLQLWHDRLNALGARDFATFLMKDPFSENEAPGIIVIGETEYQAGTLQNPLPGTKTFNPGFPFNSPGRTLIDGFTISGSKAGGAIFALTGAGNLVISNINATGNQGSYAGGIAAGTQDSGFDCNNDNIVIRYCKIHKNGGTQGPGGICMNEYANDYLIEWNLVWGNFSRFNGGGIGHRGLCPGNNIIRNNKVIFNEDHFGALLAAAGDGGGIYIGGDIAGGTGTGNVTINGNLIQGNMTGSGYGGGIRAYAINAEDVLLSPNDSTSWYTLNIFNNMIVNNVAALGGAGISLQDAAKVNIVNNTIANNDCTATAALAFTAGQLNSTPQPSGVVGAKHSDLLVALFGPGTIQTYSNPLLADNIIWHNRSWYNDASLNGGQGGLAPRPGSPYWDLAILGSTLETDPHLVPTHCVLTAQIDPATGKDYGTTNDYSANPMFVAPYENTLRTAAVLDEGGNFINVLIDPIVVTGDYHITCGSPAINLGDFTITDFPDLDRDYDGQIRPGGIYVDAGADEIRPNCSADFDVDGDVDILDLNIFTSNWMTVCENYRYPPCDLNQDGVINFWDFVIFASQYNRTNCCP